MPLTSQGFPFSFSFKTHEEEDRLSQAFDVEQLKSDVVNDHGDHERERRSPLPLLQNDGENPVLFRRESISRKKLNFLKSSLSRCVRERHTFTRDKGVHDFPSSERST